MASPELIRLLQRNVGAVLTPELLADICMASDQLSVLLDPEQMRAAIRPQQCGEFTFSVERIEDIESGIRPLHLAHWKETEAHRHGLPFNPDYATFRRYERAGRYLLFTVRREWALVGNCAMYLDMSAHTQTLIATEDTLYLLPAARKGRTAMRFVRYVEDSLQKLGVKEICITVKTVNKAERFFRMQGYQRVESGLTKILETENV